MLVKVFQGPVKRGQYQSATRRCLRMDTHPPRAGSRRRDVGVILRSREGKVGSRYSLEGGRMFDWSRGRKVVESGTVDRGWSCKACIGLWQVDDV